MKTVRGSDFAELRRRVQAAGLLDRRPGYYVARLAAVLALHAGGWAALVAAGPSWWALAVAVLLAVAFAQLALVAHDLAHGQVLRSRRAIEFAGMLAGNLGIGMSYGWWQDKHTRHHANPNHEDHDPDVSPEILVWSTRQARASRGVARFMARRQAYLFFPLLTLEGFNLHVSSVRALPMRKRRGLEAALLLAHAILYLGAVFTVLPLGLGIAFIAVHQAAFGVYLGCTFAPNHKGMPTLTGDEDLDFLRRQVLTSRNVDGGWLVDALLGGLNHQIEHHLFPSMPTPNLRRARTLVRRHCAEIGVPYESCGLVESYRTALRHLHAVGEPLR